MVLIFTLLTIMALNWKNKYMPYKDAEKEIRLLAQKYKDASTVPDGGKVTLQELIDAGLISELKVKDEVCEGYVKIEKTGGVYKHIGFVKCENYTTKGY